MTQNGKFNPSEHLMQLKSREGTKDYLPVQWRLVWFRELCPDGTIETEEVQVDIDREVEEEVYAWNAEKKRSEKTMKRAKGYARFRATVTDGKGGRATGTKSETAASFPDYIEKAETGAIGRALAALGYGTQFVGDEFDESHRIVDAPVVPQEHHVEAVPSQVQTGVPALATEQQAMSIGKLCELLNKSKPANMSRISFGEAKELIASLTQEYRAMRATGTR